MLTVKIFTVSAFQKYFTCRFMLFFRKKIISFHLIVHICAILQSTLLQWWKRIFRLRCSSSFIQLQYASNINVKLLSFIIHLKTATSTQSQVLHWKSANINHNEENSAFCIFVYYILSTFILICIVLCFRCIIWNIKI